MENYTTVLDTKQLFLEDESRLEFLFFGGTSTSCLADGKIHLLQSEIPHLDSTITEQLPESKRLLIELDYQQIHFIQLRPRGAKYEY